MDFKESYKQLPLESIFTYNKNDKLDQYSFHQLLFTHLVRFKAKDIRTDTDLEKKLQLKFIRKENEKPNSHFIPSIDDVKVFILPNHVKGNTTVYNGIAQVIFFRCVASYLESKIGPGHRIGIAGGKTVSAVMKMVERTENFRNCQLFPLLKVDGAAAASLITSSSIWG